MKRKTQNRLAGILIVLLTIVIVVVGLVVSNSKKKKESEEATFAPSSVVIETEALGKFDELGTTDAPIDYTDETTAYMPEDLPTTNSAFGTVTTLPGVPSTVSTTAPGTTLHNYAAGEDYAYAYAGYKPQPAKIDPNNWNMMLVNRNYILPQDYSPALSEAAKGTGVRMDARVSPHYQAMYDAAKKDGITLTPLSGHRRISTQKTNFENKIQKYMNQGYDKVTATQKAAEIILPPGTSEHNAGIAMDIISLDVEFEQTQAFRWLCNHAEEYGFILRYPKGKESITEITYEPWHWRYVGVENAKAINSSGKCLEEYLGVR